MVSAFSSTRKSSERAGCACNTQRQANIRVISALCNIANELLFHDCMMLAEFTVRER
jgi:hypothetical protein